MRENRHRLDGLSMSPKDCFDEVWRRADLFVTLHGYISNNVAAALQPDELLRAEWAMRVSALDLFVHELVFQNLLKTFQGLRPATSSFRKLPASADLLLQARTGLAAHVLDGAFDLEIRSKLSRASYQFPEDIAEGVRLISPIELWNEVARHQGATPQSVSTVASSLKASLTMIVNRRNKIVHEGDMQPGFPRTAWPLARADLVQVKATIEAIVLSINSVVI